MTTKTAKGKNGKQPELPGLSSRPQAGKGKPPKGRRGRGKLTPVKMSKDRNWGPIAVFVAVGVLAVGIIGYAFWVQRSTGVQPWQERAAAIEGIEVSDRNNLDRQHNDGIVPYDVLPPVGGQHNNEWQNCEGVVYPAPIANEHAVHSLEHGAVWVTYEPTLLSPDQVSDLAGYVDGFDYIMMSPFPGLDAPISLQAWGYQLKVDSPDDGRIAEFIRALRTNGPEAGATCGGGVTTTGNTPTSIG